MPGFYRCKPALQAACHMHRENADSMAALEHAQSLGRWHSRSIRNVATSAMVRQTGLKYLTRAGVAIGVAATKQGLPAVVACSQRVAHTRLGKDGAARGLAKREFVQLIQRDCQFKPDFRFGHARGFKQVVFDYDSHD